MSISALPTAPSTANPTNFATLADAFIAALPTFRTEANALAASLNSIAAGGAMTIPYTFSTTTTDADPGAGFLRLSNATQNAATVIRADLVGSDAKTWTSLIDTFDDSTATIKGYIMLQSVADGSKWLIFSVSALASPSGYKNITVANVAYSEASPFANNDSIVLKFSPTFGLVSDLGAIGFYSTPYDAGTKSSGTFTPDPANGNQQYCVNGGAFTLAPPATATSIVLEVLNNGSAGAITTSGFTKVTGAFTTTNTNKFLCVIVKTQNYSLLQIQALQ